MEFLEKDLEKIIYEASDSQLKSAGLEVKGKRKRQLKIGNYGVTDMVTMDKSYDADFDKKIYCQKHPRIVITVYELKKERIGISAFLQAINYVKGIKRYIKKRNLFEEVNIQYRIVLIGKTADTSGSFIYLPDLFLNKIEYRTDYYDIERPLDLKFYTYSYNIDGIKFIEENGYNLQYEGF